MASPWFALWKARRVFYIVTQRRALIFEKVRQTKIHSFEASALAGFERISNGGTAGDVIFQRLIDRRGRSTQVTEVGFIGLADFRGAEGALREMIANHGPKNLRTD